MLHSEMVFKLAKSGEAILETLTSNKAHVWHMASCIMGEAAELMVSVNKDCPNEIDRPNQIEELGDIEFYLEGLRQGLDIFHMEVTGRILTAPLPPVVFDVDGIVVEAANIFDACKKWIIYEKEVDCEALYDALARFELYMADFREEHNITHEEVIRANMAKLAKRYGADYNYSNAAAQNRADKQ